MNQHEDQKYLIALRNGDSILLKELYSKYTPSVKNWIMQNNGSLSDAKDVFQEAILALYNKACDPDFVLSYPIGGLIFQICKNKWIDQLRQKNRESEVRKLEKERYIIESPSSTSLLEQIQEEEIRQSKLDKTFKQLSELCQKLLKLLAEGVASKDVAKQLAMTDSNTVYRRKSACMKRWHQLYHS